MISLEWGSLVVRLCALVLYATLTLWIGGAAVGALGLAYTAMTEGDVDHAFVLLMSYFAPAVVTWVLARYFWRNAEDLVMPPELESDEWTDEPRGGQELFAAGMIVLGAYLLVTGVRGLTGAWMAHRFFLAYGMEGARVAISDVRSLLAVAVCEIVAAVIFIFAGRFIAARFQPVGSSQAAT